MDLDSATTGPSRFVSAESPEARKIRRVFALSDIHVDYEENLAWIRNISDRDYAADALILGGDVTDKLELLRKTLALLKLKFAEVFFVPGNHELWIRRRECEDSRAKFFEILKLCASLSVHTSPAALLAQTAKLWIVPLFSWYRKPEEGSRSLFVEKAGDENQDIWADDHFTRWHSLGAGMSVADMFLRMNETNVLRRYDAPVISFSHFLPRPELMFWTREEAAAVPKDKIIRDPNPSFNFSRVAGCAGLEKQIRALNSRVHVYGHQHRNRDRCLDGTRYVSHCLGYPHERENGQIHHVEQAPFPVWPL